MRLLINKIFPLLRYIEDCVSREEALQLLTQSHALKPAREAELVRSGLPAYTTAAGWLGYSQEKIVRLRWVPGPDLASQTEHFQQAVHGGRVQ